ncbi:hypothetical protein EYD10_02454 [Varanus komodoensis]|nr:hypothetical protein EYD10_02454 [Varanus komodoensis]
MHRGHDEEVVQLRLLPKSYWGVLPRVNEVSKFDTYLMPQIDGLLDPLGQAHFLLTPDLTKGYWQIPLMEESKEKTAFATPVGLFQFKYMPFGLHGAAATFQRLMDKVLGHLSHCAAAYIDDIVIFSRTWGEHLVHLWQVLLALRQAGLTANPGKCRIVRQEVQYLGYIVGHGRIWPMADKVEKLSQWRRTRTKKEVQQFLGLASYYR